METAALEPAKPIEACPACGNGDIRVLFRASDRLYRTTTTTFQVVECKTCRLVRLSPRPKPSELCHYYPPEYWYVPSNDTASRLAEGYRKLVLRDHVRFVEKAIEHSASDGLVLDVGCGGGLFLRMLKERGHKVVGLDFSLAAAGFAWEQNHVPTVCASLTHAPIPLKSCSTITMFHVLEHLFDPSATLKAAHELLQPEGRLVVQVPNAACWQFLLLGENWSGADVPRHLWDFRARDLEILLDRCGFEVVRTKHFSLRDNPAGLATSIAPGLDPMVRRVRGEIESPRKHLLKDCVYFGLVVASLPFALLEAACRAGSTVMMEARKSR